MCIWDGDCQNPALPGSLYCDYHSLRGRRFAAPGAPSVPRVSAALVASVVLALALGRAALWVARFLAGCG